MLSVVDLLNDFTAKWDEWRDLSRCVVVDRKYGVPADTNHEHVRGERLGQDRVRHTGRTRALKSAKKIFLFGGEFWIEG